MEDFFLGLSKIKCSTTGPHVFNNNLEIFEIVYLKLYLGFYIDSSINYLYVKSQSKSSRRSSKTSVSLGWIYNVRTTASELTDSAWREYPPSSTTLWHFYIFRSPYVIQANPAGETFTPPKGSPLAESKPAEIMIKSGANFLIIGKKRLSQT